MFTSHLSYQTNPNPSRNIELLSILKHGSCDLDTPRLVSLKCWNCGKEGHRKVACPDCAASIAVKMVIQRDMFQHRLTLIQNTLHPPGPRNMPSEINEKEEKPSILHMPIIQRQRH